MAKRRTPAPSYSADELSTAIDRIEKKELSYRKAESMYGIPRSTLHDHVVGKATSSRRGPATILTPAEENMLVQWSLHMADIGYGRTREQLCMTVKKILDKDGRVNPFRDNCPGKDWWYAFLRRHPELSVRLPESLQVCRAYSCTPGRLDKWYKEFGEFLELHGLCDKPRRIWNADESGFPLCPKTTRVIAMRNKRHVYSVNSDQKMQITTLVAASAAGAVIPPMHVFPGVRFRYNPLDGCIDGAYFGKSESGWMITELFYGWVANHFAAHIPPERPVLLLVDGHTTHIDVETSKFCTQNGILLYCLPPHSSHVTQPLDVGFFGALKGNWKKAVDDFKIAHLGSSVTKETFARVFSVAWRNTVKMSTIVNSFERAGIYPLNAEMAKKGGTLNPARLYQESSDSSSVSTGASDSDASDTYNCETHTASLSLKAVEAVMDPTLIRRYNCRYAEGYDIAGDSLYEVWVQLKKLSLSSRSSECTSRESSPPGEEASQTGSSRANSGELPRSAPSCEPQASVAPAFADILTYPGAIRKKKPRSRLVHPMPSHLNSSQMIEYFEAQKRQKAEQEQEKQRKKAEREAKKKEKEEAKARKQAEKEEKARQKTASKQRSSVRSRARSARLPPPSESESESEDVDEGADEAACTCPVCGGAEDDDSEGDEWVACDCCEAWYHLSCSSVPPSSYVNVANIQWVCQSCKTA